jgi:hypothetical protein
VKQTPVGKNQKQQQTTTKSTSKSKSNKMRNDPESTMKTLENFFESFELGDLRFEL